MTRNYIRKTNNRDWSVENLNRALQAIRQGIPVQRAAKKYQIPRATLQRYAHQDLKQGGVQIITPGWKTVFTEAQEQQLVRHVLNLTQHISGLTTQHIRRAAFAFAEKNKIQHPFDRVSKAAGRDWCKAFLRRHKEIKLERGVARNVARDKAFNREDVGKFFDKLKAFMDGCQNPDARVYNVDETLFSTVACYTSDHTLHFSDETEQFDTVSTAIFAMSASGDFVPPLFVFPPDRMPASFQEKAPPGSIFEYTARGWSAFKTYTRWFEHFINYTKPTKEAPVLLIIGERSIFNRNPADPKKLAKQNHVHIVTVPEHTEHKLQPLNVGFMPLLKANYTVGLEMFSERHSAVTFHDIPSLVNEAYTATATTLTAADGFRACGIVPFNPEIFPDSDYAAADFLRSSEVQSGEGMDLVFPGFDMDTEESGAEIQCQANQSAENGQPARHTDTSHPDWVPSLALPESSKRKSQSRATSDERFELIIPDEGHAAGEERLIVSSGQEIKVEDLLDGDEENFEIEALEDDVAAIDGFKVEAAGDLYEIHEVGGPETTDQDPETTDDELETKGRFPFTVRAKPPKDVQIPPTRDLEKKNAKLLETLDELKQRVADLEKRLGVKNRDFECLKDSKKCSFFTGFHSVLLLKRIFGIVGPFLDQQDTRFTKEQMFVMTLTKLKLNVMYTMLAYDYDVSAETIVKSFQHTITTMHRCLKHTLVPSPKEVAVQKTPSMFSAALGHKRIYILCPFHTKTENSSGVRDSMSNFMSDKKIETVKFLIAVHPDGTFAFVSDGYSVKHTDLYMVNNSGFLSCVEADDVVLVDKRFEFMSDMVGLKKATLIVSNYLHSTIKNRAESLVGIIRLKYNYLAGPLHTKTLLPIEEDFEISNVVVKVACIVSNLNKAQKAVKSVPGESSLQ
ncbi:uncharacterized protein LOC129751753 isoform X1 [Uranotaenia lowii]|uniref:uncharacterized protein LOC129751753 isoform X1 n=1 Tax=Uranotaenia lowii TaxID=190385 RepID=UPI0024798F59|nr:uncharacterized protein LOC129751753 isoform X1 [Uranotaenia lowii]